MSILYTLRLLVDAHLNLSNCRPHSGHSYHDIEEEGETNYSWREAEGYNDCEEFLVDTDNLDFYENILNELLHGTEELYHFRKSLKTKPPRKICHTYECVPFQKVEV